MAIYSMTAKLERRHYQINSNVFFTESHGAIPDTHKCYSDINNLVVTEDGVRKLLQNMNTSQSAGPDLILNIVLKHYVKENSHRPNVFIQRINRN